MANEENIAEIREQLNLNAPIYERYTTWLGNIFKGDFGYSISLERDVRIEIFERLQATLVLAGAAFLLCAVVGLGLGTFMAVKQFSRIERITTLFVMTGIALPAFWLGLILVLVFSVWLKWFPSSGMSPVYQANSIDQFLLHLFLPAITLALVSASLIARVMRAQMIETLRQPFIRTARSKGLPECTVIWRHAFKNGMVPMVPLLGLQAGYVFGGAVYVETIFQWPGLGRMLVQAIQMRDVLLVQGGVLVVGCSYVFLNLAADLIQHALDPRTR
jgi:peptide/nickel transport system permease protein